MVLKEIHVFTSGEQISTSGKKTNFTETHLDEIASSYDPTSHEAPVLLGHTEGSGNPAYGWIKSLRRSGKKLLAQVDFTENCKSLIQQGHYKKRSSSFYQPDSPVNPTPGLWSFRHLAILGAEPPSVKGLEDFAFMESTEEFSAFEPEDVRIEFEEEESKMTKENPKEKLDEAIKVAEETKVDAVAAASEGEPSAEESLPVEMEEESLEDTTRGEEIMALENQIKELKAELEELKSSVVAPEELPMVEEESEEFKELKAEVAKLKLAAEKSRREKRSLEMGIEIGQLYSEAKLVPGVIQQSELQEFLEGAEFGTLEFSEGDSVSTKIIDLLRKLPKQVTFEEIADSDPENFKETEEEPVHVKAKKMADETGESFAECLKKVMYPKGE